MIHKNNNNNQGVFLELLVAAKNPVTDDARTLVISVIVIKVNYCTIKAVRSTIEIGSRLL